MAFIAALGLVLAVCRPTAASETTSLTVFAGSSLAEALEEIGASYRQGHPMVDFTFNFAGSSTLATQIEQGAQADLFISSDEPQMARVQSTGLVEGNPTIIATNRLVVVTPKDGVVQGLQDLAQPGRKIVLALSSVPAGNYASESLQRLGRDPAFGEGFATSVLANVVSEETNVRQVLAKVQLGEADAGIVYATDAIVGGEAVRTIPIPDSYNVTAVYPAAVLRTSVSPTTARDFLSFLGSAEAQEVLRRRGFGVP